MMKRNNDGHPAAGDGGADPDAAVVERARSGDREACEELVLRHQRRAFNTAYRILGDYDEALDIVQDAFLQAFRALSSFRGDARFVSWLLAITVNLCRNRLKQWGRRRRSRTVPLESSRDGEGRRTGVEIADDCPSPLENVAAGQLARIVREEMMKIEEEYRTVLVLKEMQDLSYEEIAGVLKLPAGTVKSRLHRGRARLQGRVRARLRPKGDAP